MNLEPDAQDRDPKEALQFHLEEFRQLRAEILQHSRTQTQLEIFTVIAVALIFWFLATNERILGDRPGARFLAWWSPIFIVFAGYILSRAFVRRNYQIGAYLKSIEKRFAAGGQGWEHCLHTEGGRRRRAISPAKGMFWVVLTFLTILTSALFALPGSLARFVL